MDPNNLPSLLDEDEKLEQNWIYVALVIIPLTCVVGNGLVIAAVWSTKSLQTSTNYLLVSLACADLLIGLCVMPLNIYVSVNALHWHLSAELCYIYCLLDVSASTCSIAHLVLISIDRLVAATKPAEYKTQKHKRRVHIAIISTWLFSICISLPLVTGFNTSTRKVLLRQHHCGIYNPVYMLCSSIFAFYMPCLIMSITYGYIFHTLRRRLRAIQLQEMAGGQFLGFGADVGNIATSAIETVTGVEAKNRNMITWEKPLLRKIEETAAEHASSLNDSEREQLQTILEAAQPSYSSTNNSQYELTATYIETDDISDRPPSVVLEAITLRNNNNNYYSYGSNNTLSCGASSNGGGGTLGASNMTGAKKCSQGSTLALEVPKCVPRKIPTRRFSDAIQSNFRRYTEKNSLTTCLGDSPTSEDEESNNATACIRSRSNISWSDLNNNKMTTNNDVRTADQQLSSLPLAQRQLRQQQQQKKPMQKLAMDRTTLRRHSYQPPSLRQQMCNEVEDGGMGTHLKPNMRNKTMRRLSDIISEWERPSRASLGQMYSFARRESVYIARKKLAGLKDWALDLLAKLKSKQGMAIRRETRATKLVATVMGVFLICWMPFFTLNMVKVYRLMNGNWPTDLESLFHWSSALGYLNSSLNFVIYSAINKKFRSSFRRLVGLSSRRKRKSWMLPPRGGAGVNNNNHHSAKTKDAKKSGPRFQHSHHRARRQHCENKRHTRSQHDDHRSAKNERISRSCASKIEKTGEEAQGVLFGLADDPAERNNFRRNSYSSQTRGGETITVAREAGVSATVKHSTDEIVDTPPLMVGGCGCMNAGPFNPARSSRSSKSAKSARTSSSNPLALLTRRFSIRKPEIIIDEVSAPSEEHISISADGCTTYRHSSDDCIRRSSSEMIGGEVYPSNRHHESRRDSGMSNSSASLQLHDMHQIADQSSHEAEIFV